MVDIIILAIVAVAIIFAIKASVKHFKGEGACCGGGSSTVPTKVENKVLDNPIIGKKTLKISGMHCENCVAHVTEAINDIDGAAAKVNLKDETAIVVYDRELDDQVIKDAVSHAGYQVVSILG